MKIGIFYEHQLPRAPPAPTGTMTPSAALYQEALEQIELADRVGIDYVREVEHHFLEECSHSSAPEVFLSPRRERTRRIRLGHGITLMSPPPYNHPARVAERVAALDLVSTAASMGNRRLATAVEHAGFLIDPADKEPMWREGAEQAANTWRCALPRVQGQWFEYALPQYRPETGAAASPADVGRLLAPRNDPPRRQSRHRRAGFRFR